MKVNLRKPYSTPENFFYTFCGFYLNLTRAKASIQDILKAMDHEISKQPAGKFETPRPDALSRYAKDQCLRACLKDKEEGTFKNNSKGIFFHKKYKIFSEKWDKKPAEKKVKKKNLSPDTTSPDSQNEPKTDS
jgi:hypothetical protein